MASGLRITVVVPALALTIASVAVYAVERAPAGCLGCGELSLPAQIRATAGS